MTVSRLLKTCATPAAICRQGGVVASSQLIFSPRKQPKPCRGTTKHAPNMRLPRYAFLLAQMSQGRPPEPTTHQDVLSPRNREITLPRAGIGATLTMLWVSYPGFCSALWPEHSPSSSCQAKTP